MLKALIVETEQTPTYTHDLVRLARQAGLELSAQQLDFLEEISKFNLAARYDDEKETFYKRATVNYTKQWLIRVEEIMRWLDGQFK